MSFESDIHDEEEVLVCDEFGYGKGATDSGKEVGAQ